jgi:hypothetical protein
MVLASSQLKAQGAAQGIHTSRLLKKEILEAKKTHSHI